MRFSGDSQWGNADDLILNYKTIPTTWPRARRTRTAPPSAPAPSRPGSYQFLAYIDGFNTVPESNEDNNVLASGAQTVVYANQVWIGTDILGTSGNDVILLNATADTAFITVNGQTGYKPLTGVTQFFVDAGAGNDVIYADPGLPRPHGRHRQYWQRPHLRRRGRRRTLWRRRHGQGLRRRRQGLPARRRAERPPVR
jgi:Ca2+-binding RTX toxin-like protein